MFFVIKQSDMAFGCSVQVGADVEIGTFTAYRQRKIVLVLEGYVCLTADIIKLD